MEVVWGDRLTFISVARDHSVSSTRYLNNLVRTDRRQARGVPENVSVLNLSIQAPIADPCGGHSWQIFFFGRHRSGNRKSEVYGLMLTQSHQSVFSSSWCSCPGLGHQRGLCTHGAGAEVVCVLVIFSHLTLFSSTDPGWGGWASGKGGWVCTSGSQVDEQQGGDKGGSD